MHAASRLEADLGLDSLGRVELAAFLEQSFGVAVPEARLAAIRDRRRAGALRLAGRAARAARRASPGPRSCRPRGRPPLPQQQHLHRAIVYASRVAVRLFFRTGRGRRRLPAGPCILAPNHQSFFDGLFVTAHMRPRAVLRTLFYAKAKHVTARGCKFLAGRSNTIVMNPDEGFRRSLQKLAAALRRGNNVMIFPEGTRSAGRQLGAFKESYAILARELDVPVVPVVIDGAHRVLPRAACCRACSAGLGHLPRAPAAAGGRAIETFNDACATRSPRNSLSAAAEQPAA